jgi:hypothetical protein
MGNRQSSEEKARLEVEVETLKKKLEEETNRANKEKVRADEEKVRADLVENLKKKLEDEKAHLDEEVERRVEMKVGEQQADDVEKALIDRFSKVTVSKQEAEKGESELSSLFLDKYSANSIYAVKAGIDKSDLVEYSKSIGERLGLTPDSNQSKQLAGYMRDIQRFAKENKMNKESMQTIVLDCDTVQSFYGFIAVVVQNHNSVAIAYAFNVISLTATTNEEGEPYDLRRIMETVRNTVSRHRLLVYLNQEGVTKAINYEPDN